LNRHFLLGCQSRVESQKHTQDENYSFHLPVQGLLAAKNFLRIGGNRYESVRLNSGRPNARLQWPGILHYHILCLEC